MNTHGKKYDPITGILSDHLKYLRTRLDEIYNYLANRGNAPDVIRQNGEFIELLGKKDERIIQLYKRIEELEADNKKLYEVAFDGKTTLYRGDGTCEVL